MDDEGGEGMDDMDDMEGMDGEIDGEMEGDGR